KCFVMCLPKVAKVTIQKIRTQSEKSKRITRKLFLKEFFQLWQPSRLRPLQQFSLQLGRLR
ncbi:hypothetical protein, partial [Vibrio parahaemolyticus]|uniref:hypothetical protein n=1 Tax=Vibrio parahaemolyticus TaxID=670 RepID=UPI001E3BDF74